MRFLPKLLITSAAMLALPFLADAQTNKIVFDKTSITQVDSFYDKKKITESAVNAGFELHVPVSMKARVKVENGAGKFDDIPDSIKSNTKFTIWLIKNPSRKNGVARIEIEDKVKKKKYTVQINISADSVASVKPEPLPKVGIPSCVESSPLTITGKSTCKESTPGNDFGETIKTLATNTILYVYDFNNKRFYKVERKSGNTLETTVPVNMKAEKIKANQMVMLKVVNVNKFLYSVSVTDTALHLFSEPSPLLKQLFIGDSNLQANLLSIVNKQFTGTDITPKNSGENEEKAPDIYNDIRCLLRKYIDLQSRMLEIYYPCNSFKCCEELLRADYAEIAKTLLDVRSKAAILQNMVNDAKVELKTASDKLDACKKTVTELDKNAADLKDIQKKIDDDTKKMAGLTNEKEKEELQKKITENEKKRDELTAKKATLEKTKCTDDDIKTAMPAEIERLKGVVNSMKSIDDILSKLPSDVDIREAVVIINNMVKSNSEETFGPLATNGNGLQLMVNISPRDSIYSRIVSRPKPVYIELPIVHKSFVSFSAGSFVGLHDRLKNKTYDWQQIPNANNTVLDTAKYRLVESGYTPPVMGFSAFANFQYSFTENFGLGGSAGVGMTIERDPRITYLIGGSAFFGKESQLVVTAGLAFMQVNKLKNNFMAVADQGIIYSSKPDPEYFKEVKSGLFFSISYTLFTINKRK